MIRGLAFVAAFALFAALAILTGPLLVGRAAAQEIDQGADAIPDSLFLARNHEPVSYFTTYNRDLSSGVWTQSLVYRHNTRLISFGLDGSTVTNDGLRGLTNRAVNGDLGGSLTFRATNRWLWALDGRGGVLSNEDDRSKTTRHTNRLQLRTQYTFNISSRFSGMGILFGELQQDQSLGNRTIPGDQYQLIDSTAAPFDTTVFNSHARRDSSFTSGLRDGLSGSVRWVPAPWLEMTGAGAATSIHSSIHTLERHSWGLNPGDVPTYVTESDTTVQAPNGDQRFEVRTNYTGLKRSTASMVVRNLGFDQKYYALNKGSQEHLSKNVRGADFHFDTMPLNGLQMAIDGNLAHSFQEYDLQKNLTSRSNSATMNTALNYWKSEARASIGFQLGRTQSDRQVTQNGTAINRSLSASGGKRVSRRLWLDGAGTISLFSRTYDDTATTTIIEGQKVNVSDRDDVKGSANIGGGYRVSERCSTTVHFSTARTHAVAIHPSSSGGNNVQTTYQMDATLRVQATRTFTILQNYMINANYQIFDYNELNNTLTRIRRIDTTLSDSVFSFAFIRFDHNFWFQDRGAFTREEEGADRTYSVAVETYQQNVSVTVGACPFAGILFTATQSLANTRNYLPSASKTVSTNRNRWNLRIGGSVDRQLPGDMALQGSVQRVSEYTETPADRPAIEFVDYWIATVSLNKDF